MALKFKVKVPGTSANIGVGYDCLGVALDYHLELEVEESDKIEFLENGKSFSIPIEDNYIFEAIKYTEKHLVKNIPSYKVNIIKNDIPLARGLGSSSSAIVAGILIANTFAGNVLDTQKIVKLAVEMEGHPDNVVPAILGGMVLTAHDKDNIVYSTVSNCDDLYYYVMIPDFKLSTEKARSVLPKSYLVSDVINNMAKLGLLVNDLNNGKYDNLRFLLGDKLHQPYRYALINNSQEIFEATKRYGALGEYISGAGPTLMALNYNNDDFLNKMKEFLNTLPDRWTIDKKKVNLKGAEVFDIENV